MPVAPPEPCDFFISYAGADRAWAEWIAFVLKESGKSVLLQAWHFRPGQHIVDLMAQGAEARHTIAVFSEAYFSRAFTVVEWQAAVFDDLGGTDRRLIPVRVEKCDIPRLIRQKIYVDLVGIDREEARGRLIEMLEDDVSPTTEPNFPGGVGAKGQPPAPRNPVSPDAAPRSGPWTARATRTSPVATTS